MQIARLSFQTNTMKRTNSCEVKTFLWNLKIQPPSILYSSHIDLNASTATDTLQDKQKSHETVSKNVKDIKSLMI